MQMLSVKFRGAYEMNRWQIIPLSLRDYLYDGRLSLCSVLGLAAVLAPIMVLYGLKFGIISSMLDDLNRDPLTREIKILGQGEYTKQSIEDFANIAGVSYAIANTRFLSATLRLSSPESSRKLSIRAEMLPSSQGDPFLADQAGAFPQGNKVFISTRLAEELDVTIGDTLTGKIGRIVNKENQAVRINLEVGGILPLTITQRKILLVSLDLLLASEDYREGFSVPERGWEGIAKAPAERVYASFRLFAKTIDDVEYLRKELQSLGIETKTRLEQINMVKTFDRNLTALFLIISALAAIGYALAMVVSVLASISRKQKDISILKLLGFSDFEVSLLPVIQSLLTALIGSFVAISLYFIAAEIINSNFSEGLNFGNSICALHPRHFVIAVLSSCFLAGVTSILGGRQAASIMPADGIRNE